MIKTKVPQPVEDALSALLLNPNFKVFRNWLEENLQETRVQNDDLCGEDLTRNQGCAKTLAKILKTADEAG